MSRARAASAAILSMVLACVAGGCTLEPRPDPGAGKDADSPAPAQPTMPAVARDHTDAGAVAFVRYFYEVQNYAMATGDVDQLEALASEACRECREDVASFAAGDQLGHWVGGNRTVDRTDEVPPGDIGHWAAHVTGSDAPATLVLDDGQRKAYDGGPFELDLYLVWKAGGWAVHWMIPRS